jgi:formate hydrogenlyase subunit 3/multisubunit Na+/H+ antiporter MnhD subunit
MRRAASGVALTGAAATLAAVVAVALEVRAGGIQRHDLGGWDVPLGIALHADGLTSVMLLLTGLAGTLITAYAAAEFRRQRDRAHSPLFWPVWLTLWGGLNALYLASDVFNIYVLLELTGIAAVALVVQSRESAASVAGMRYLLATLMGSAAYLLGVVLLYGVHGVLDLHTLGAVLARHPASLVAFALMLGGLVLKTALFPLHFWLPQAHASALTPVSAALSGMVVTAYFYVVLRLWFDTFSAVRTQELAQLVGALGAFAILWGSYRAIRQRRLKLLIAHSTVGQVGYLFLLFPLATTAAAEPWAAHAWTGGVYHAVSHGFAKAAMFLAAGVVLHATGTDDVHAMRDIAGRLPIVTFTFGIAGASLIGLPPSGGFIAKWLLMHAAIESGQWWWLPVLATGALLTAAYVFVMVRYSFQRAGSAPALEHVPAVRQYLALALALAAIAVGVRLEEPLALLSIGAPMSLREATQ